MQWLKNIFNVLRVLLAYVTPSSRVRSVTMTLTMITAAASGWYMVYQQEVHDVLGASFYFLVEYIIGPLFEYVAAPVGRYLTNHVIGVALVALSGVTGYGWRRIRGKKQSVKEKLQQDSLRCDMVRRQMELQKWIREYPQDLRKIEQGIAHTERSLSDAKRTVKEREDQFSDATASLVKIKKEHENASKELKEIESELQKLAKQLV